MLPERKVGLVETVKNSILKAPSYVRELRNYISNLKKDDILNLGVLVGLPVFIIGGIALFGDPHLATKVAIAVVASYVLAVPTTILSIRSHNKDIQ